MFLYWLTLASIVALYFFATISSTPGAMSPNLKSLSFKEGIAATGLLIAAVTAFSGVYFGWREDHREAVEAQLRVHELELKIAQLEKAQNSN